MYKRPQPEETDEDLLSQQQEFLEKLKQNKIELAAQVVPSKKLDDQKTSVTSEGIGQDIEEQLSNTFECIPSNINIGNIVEKRKIDDDKFSALVFNKDCGFPKAKRRDVNVPGGSRSIFAQNLQKLNRTNVSKRNVNMDIDEQKDFVLSSSHIIKQSKILKEADKEEIHKENVDILKSTPEVEILEERERLLSTMDPAIIAFLKDRRKYEKVKNNNPSIQEQNEAGYKVDVENITPTASILNIPGSDKWFNFNLLETHKLAWMKDIQIPKIDKNKAFEARFDFEGWLLPFLNAEMNEKTRILYHHGEEPERPGYTLQELFTLARSSVIQQKIIALNSVSNILSLSSTGIYQDILEIPIEQLFFLIRFSLDDNTPGVLNASIKAMRSIFFNNIDETCLDCLLGFGFENYLPILPVDCVDEDDNTVNDQQLAEQNLVRCVLRTGICTRIRYILNTIQPPLETIVYCLETLIRLCKDSDFVLSEVLKTENLMSTIVQKCLPVTGVNCNVDSIAAVPTLQAVKLVRVICCRNKKLSSEFIDRYNIVHIIASYLQDETFGLNTNGMKLQTECIYLWRILLEYNLTLEHVSILVSILLKHLHYHFSHTNIDNHTTYVREAHCSSVLTLLGKFLTIKPSSISRFEDLILDCLTKWCYQFSCVTDFKCGKSQIISSLIYLCTMIYGYSKLTESLDKNISNLLKSTGFSEATKSIKNSSMLLNNYEPQPFSANLKTLQCSAWYTTDHVVPIIQTTSGIPFISTLSQFVSRSNNQLLKLNFLNHPNIKDYIHILAEQKRHFLTNHWFTRIESRLVMNLLQISVDIQKDIDTSVFYALAVKALCVFNEEQKEGVRFLLENIIFCSSFYPSEALMKNLELNERNKNLEVSLNNLPEIRQVYAEVLGLRMEGITQPYFCIDVGKGNIIPVDWVYTPIIMLYSNQQERKNELTEEQQIFIVKNCLRWILIYETYFPSLVSAVNATDRFCRLACVFLGNDELFLNEEIHNLLELCLRNILDKSEDQLNFDNPIEGLKNFQDFYNQMLEQFQGVSYGDLLFGNFVLVPLSQKQNVKWRKTLWSEYMGAVQILNVTREQLMLKLDNFLFPCEEDESLVKCYKIAISRRIVRPTSILHLVATHHCQEYMKLKHRKEDN